MFFPVTQDVNTIVAFTKRHCPTGQVIVNVIRAIMLFLKVTYVELRGPLTKLLKVSVKVSYSVVKETVGLALHAHQDGLLKKQMYKNHFLNLFRSRTTRGKINRSLESL